MANGTINVSQIDVLTKSGTGTVSIVPPNTNTNRTLTLPDTTGTFNTSGAVNEVPAGSASAPSIYPTGDTNTGEFFPAADTIAWTTGGSERMRINSSGNVGINNTDPSASAAAGARNLVIGNSSASTAGITIATGTGSYVGTLNFGRGADNADAYYGYLKVDHSNGFMAFGVAATERMRITDGGEIYIAGTTDRGAYNLQCNGTGVWGAGAYVNGSDERIKDDIAPIESGLDVVEKLNPVTYRYKEDWSKDQSTQTGFIAQELLVALEGKNYVDGVVQQGGSEGYYSVAYQNIIPILTKAIQELSAKVEAQAAEIAALKGN